MQENALISIVTSQSISGVKDNVRLDTRGKFAIRDGKAYIIYKESEMTGYDDTTTTIKISDDCVTVKRNGDYRSTMKYKEGEMNLCSLQTPYGEMAVAIRTDALGYRFTPNGGRLSMGYVLDADNRNAIKNEMDLIVKTDETVSETALELSETVVKQLVERDVDGVRESIPREFRNTERSGE
ncbi:MAG TPA: DUF1934 domain-containing protein [Firmicutes bacterium]|nr:DUF1934 domain-containing protein [Bacillota bacterium]